MFDKWKIRIANTESNISELFKMLFARWIYAFFRRMAEYKLDFRPEDLINIDKSAVLRGCTRLYAANVIYLVRRRVTYSHRYSSFAVFSLRGK